MTEGSEWQFGYNCKHYTLSIGKCRILSDRYKHSEKLLVQRWLSTADLLAYVSASREELLRQITSGEIKAMFQKDGKMTYGISAPWRYDDCFLASSGGRCLYFEAHNGPKISCLSDLSGLKATHPNVSSAPSEADERAFEESAIQIIEAAMGNPTNDVEVVTRRCI